LISEEEYGKRISGKAAWVDLTSGKLEEEELNDDFCRKYIGDAVLELGYSSVAKGEQTP
jgi:hypothetical protein